MLGATLPWLLRRNDRGSRRLLQFMSGPGHAPSTELIEWMTLVARTCRTTGAPAPYPDALVTRWRGQNVRIIVGDSDVFFPVDRLRKASLGKLGTNPTVVEHAGHLLGDEEPVRISNLVAELL
jgi:pimeloyl-ACP methyl ester carboxylesterase